MSTLERYPSHYLISKREADACDHDDDTVTAYVHYIVEPVDESEDKKQDEADTLDGHFPEQVCKAMG